MRRIIAHKIGTPAPSTTGNTVVVRLLVGFSPVIVVDASDLATRDGSLVAIEEVVGTKNGNRFGGMTSRRKWFRITMPAW
jgi:hypothetical protein